MDSPKCAKCNDLFLLVELDEKGNHLPAKPCPCVETGRVERYMAAAKIPDGFDQTELENYYVSHQGCTPSQKGALFMAKKFSEKSVAEMASKGMIFVGECGVGKTHLAVGILKKLIQTQKRRGLFCSSTHLMELVKATYEREDERESDLMRPVLERDILLLDDLGAGRITEFIKEKLAYILSERYNRKLTTLITTNYPVEPPRPEKERRQQSEDGKTLGDCIGIRAYSRLMEMCVVVPIQGSDFRQTVKQAITQVL